MCWFSAEHANNIEDAKAGQRLGIKKMHGDANWVVGETDLEAPRPCPVCLIDQTRVLFRFSESQQASLHFGSEAEAVFRMSKHPKRDIFEFADGKQITLGDLPAGLIFDVLAVPPWWSKPAHRNLAAYFLQEYLYGLTSRSARMFWDSMIVANCAAELKSPQIGTRVSVGRMMRAYNKTHPHAGQ